MSKIAAIDVADYMIQQAIDYDGGDLLTSLNLQKLLYYAQGCHLAIYDAPLFDEPIEAWEWGPVVSEIYHAFKVCGRQPIEDTSGDRVDIEVQAAEFLDVILEKFGRFSASRLVNMTHKEAPWQDSYVSGKNVEIDKQKLKDFFKTNWIDPDVVVENDDHGRDFAECLLKARAEAPSLPELTAQEMVEWLDKA